MRENTLLSFQKAAANHSDVIEFDVHVTADKEVVRQVAALGCCAPLRCRGQHPDSRPFPQVVHHDFEVKLKLGSSTVKLPIPVLAYQQLQRCCRRVQAQPVPRGNTCARCSLGYEVHVLSLQP